MFSADDAVKWTKDGKTVLLVREETNPEDVEGMRAAVGILTGRGGMTSHAALVARGMGQVLHRRLPAPSTSTLSARPIKADGKTFKEGDCAHPQRHPGHGLRRSARHDRRRPRTRASCEFMKLADEIRTMNVRTNADTPEDAGNAIEFGAEGIGLFRTEHMFYGKGSEEPLFILRKMIMSELEAERREALEELFPFVKRT